ncbi:MAG: aldo/keto reductase [Thermoplasmata archaeon]|nr:aldo/keto reductase [Thermoplasmata archaeon]
MKNLFSENNISKIGLGTWQMGMKGWGSDYQDSTVIDALVYGINNGINFIDTAEIYGNGKSEKLIGNALEQIDRKRVYVATKIAGFNATEKKVKKSINGSLKRMKIDYIDLYQVHWEPSIYTNMENLFKELENSIKEGLINHIGVSNFSLKNLEIANSYLKDYKIESNQIKFNLVERPRKEIIEYMNKNNIKLIAWSPLAQGFLTGKYGPGNMPKGFIRKVNKLFKEKNFKRYENLFKILRELSMKKNASITQIVLSYESSLGVLPIPGFKNKNQVKEIVDSIKIEISEDELKEITDVINELGTIKSNEEMFPRILPNFLVKIISIFI